MTGEQAGYRIEDDIKQYKEYMAQFTGPTPCCEYPALGPVTFYKYGMWTRNCARCLKEIKGTLKPTPAAAQMDGRNRP